MKDKDKIKQWLDDGLSSEDKQSFQQTEDYRFLDRLSKALQSFKAPEYPVEDELRRFHSVERVKQISMRTWTAWKVAASLVLVGAVALALILFRSADEGVRISSADQSQLILPDSSFVNLNAHSSITYFPEDWTRGTKQVDLDGEAYFEVKTGLKFTVVSDQGEVQVLGTKFNVKDRENYFEVTCYEGSVAVKNQQANLTLTPGEQFRLINGKKEVAEVMATFPSWLEDLSRFDSVPYYEVIKELERQYNVQVECVDCDLTRHFTGSFVHNDLSVALKTITIPLSLNYKIKEDSVILYK